MTKEFENNKIWKGKWDQYVEPIVKAENNRTMIQAIENLEHWVYRHFSEKEEIIKMIDGMSVDEDGDPDAPDFDQEYIRGTQHGNNQALKNIKEKL